MRLPSHFNPSPDRTASAPYNFVPLPEVVVNAVENADDLPDQDRFHSNRYTGYFDITLTTKSPLYVRAMLTRDEYERQDDPAEEKKPFRERMKNKSGFFSTKSSGEPVIPGSSLRGMLRNLLEVVSYGKMEWVTEKQLFFRTMDPSTVGDYYRERMSGKVEAGFLRRQGNRYVIKKCECVRVFRKDLGGKIYEMQKNWETPRWNGKPHQHIPIWIRKNTSGKLVKDLAYEERNEYEEGRLVITGNMKVKNPKKSKKKEFVFLLPEGDTEEISIPDEMLERFHDDDQITQWQQKAFPSNQPKKNSRVRDGFIVRNPKLPGDPVFFLRENGKLTFFGRAQMFRLPYQRSPRDFVPNEWRRESDIDFAEAIFGYVKGKESGGPQGSKARAYASRVFVTDAKLIEGQVDIWLSKENKAIVPRILASPKPTAFQHYLVQSNPDNSRQLYHYGDWDHKWSKTVIRGHKFYWHQGRGESFTPTEWRNVISEEKEKLATLPKDDTQHTQFKPVKPDTKFTFRVYFENLSKVELGALCWVLQPLGEEKQEYCHHLGMGKPFGMGSMKLDATLYLTERKSRYAALFAGNNWQTGLQGEGENLSYRTTLKKRVKPFKDKLLRALKPDRECEHLYQLQRIAMLLCMMEWPGFPAVLPVTPNNRLVADQNGKTRPNTRYMTIRFDDESIPAKDRNEYRDRPVLPDPSAFGRLTGEAVPSVEAKFDFSQIDASQEHHFQKRKESESSRQHKTPRQEIEKKPLEMTPEARAMLKSVEKQRQLEQAAAQSAYSNGQVEKKAKVIKNPDGTLGVALPKLKDKTFPIKTKRQFSQAKAGAKIRVRVVVDKKNMVIRVEEL